MERIIRIGIAICILSVTLLVALQVLFRYVFKIPVILIDEMLLFPTIWMYFLGCAIAAKENSQISASMMVLFVKNKRILSIINMIAALISTIISAWLLTWGYDYMLYSFKVWKTTSYSYIPLVYAEISTFVGFLLITFYTALWVIKFLKDAMRKDTQET